MSQDRPSTSDVPLQDAKRFRDGYERAFQQETKMKHKPMLGAMLAGLGTGVMLVDPFTHIGVRIIAWMLLTGGLYLFLETREK